MKRSAIEGRASKPPWNEIRDVVPKYAALLAGYWDDDAMLLNQLP